MLYLRFPGRNSGIFLCNLISSHYLCTVKLKNSKSMGQLTFKSGSGYSASWEVRNTTLCAMENQVKKLTSLINELYEAREEIPTTCTSEKDEADYQIKLLKTSIDNLNKFITCLLYTSDAADE